jgi:hypothetical protein
MSAQARALLGKYGLKPSLDINSIDLSEFDLRTREDVDNLGAAAYEEAQRLGYPGRLHYAWTKALAADLENQLPSMEYANGGIAKSIEDQARDLSFAAADSAQYFNPQLIDSRIANATLYGQRIADLPVQEARDSLSALLMDAAPSQRREIMAAIDAIDNSPASSFHSVSYEAPTELNIAYARSDEDLSGDAYQDWRNQGNVDGKGLDGLHIKPSVVANDPVWSGITNFAGGGMTYEVSSDWHYQQSVAQQSGGGDMHQGDDANVI